MLTIDVDADLCNADWPKRTPDRQKDLKGGDKGPRNSPDPSPQGANVPENEGFEAKIGRIMAEKGMKT